MNAPSNTRTALEDLKVNVRLRLSALWASVMFLYIYADYFGLHVPGALRSMLDGQMRPLGPTTQGALLGAPLMLAIPSIMIFLSVALMPVWARWLNLIFGALYTLIILITMWGWAFSTVYGIVEITLTSLVVWYAWKWPRATAISSAQVCYPKSQVRAGQRNPSLQRSAFDGG